MDDDVIIFLLVVLAIVWLFILPVVVPIVLGVKYRRIKKALLSLYNEGKISGEQYYFCTGKTPPFYNVNGLPEPKEQLSTHVDALPEPKEQLSTFIDGLPEPKEQLSTPVNGLPEPKEQLSTPVDGLPKPNEQLSTHVDALPEPKEQLSSFIDALPEPKEQLSTPVNGLPEPKEQLSTPVNGLPEPKEQLSTPVNGLPEQKEQLSTFVERQSPTAQTQKDTGEKEPVSDDILDDNVQISTPMIPIPVLLGVGVVLLCTAGAAYISSFWGTASEIVKLLAVGSFSLIFYGAFRLAHNKLQIEHSAKAFYILCIAALGITVTAAELFGLILGDVSPAAKMLLPTAVIAAGMFRGYYIFKSKLFPILGILFIFLFLTALSTAVFDDAAMMFFIPAIVSTGCLVYATLSKRALATEARKPAFVLFLVFTGLLMCSTFALDDALHKNLMTAFALALAVIMHIQLYKAFNRFVEFAIPVALGWACLTFVYSIPKDPHSIVLFACCTLLSASVIVSLFSLRRFDKNTHSITVFLYALAMAITAFLAEDIHNEPFLGHALLIPALTLIILGAHLMQHARAVSLPAPKASQTPETPETTKAVFVTKNHSIAAVGIAMCAGGLYALIGYGIIVDDLQQIAILPFNLAMSAVLLALALIPEQFKTGDIRSRRYTAFVLLVILACMQPSVFGRHYLDELILFSYPFNQLMFLAIAFAIAFIERSNAIRTNRSTFAIASQICAVALVLWIVPLCMMLLDVILNRYFIWSIDLELRDYIFPVEALVLAGILLFEPQNPLCPKKSALRIGFGASLLALSYIILSIIQEHNLTGDPTLVTLIYWCFAAIYMAIVLFYTFRKRIAYADAPHLRLRGATAVLTAMSLPQIAFNVQIAAFLLIPALALTFLDDRRSARLQSPHDQTIAAILGTILFSSLSALIFINLTDFFYLETKTAEAIQDLAFPAIALFFSLLVLAEHRFMQNSKDRPYRLVAAVDLELATACALIYMIAVFVDNHTPAVPMRLLILATGLIGTWCMSHRERRHYGFMAALAAFTGIYLMLDVGWSHLNTNEPDYFVWIATAVIAAAYAYFDGFKHKAYTHPRAVWAIAAIPLIIVHGDPYHIAHLAGVLVIALNLLQYLRDRGQSDHDRALITISSGIIAVALALKILLLPDDSWLPVMIRPELVFLIPMAALYLVSYFVWKFRNHSHEVCSVATLILLPLVYLIPDTHVQFHAITVTALAIASIMVAIRTKLNRYLTIGIVSIVIIFFSQTKSFWSSLHWWVYLAVVAVVLLTIAVINETQRRKGSTLLQLLKQYIGRLWKW